MKKEGKQKERCGFTIVELLVAVSVFSVFLAVAVGSFTRVLQIQRTLSRRIMVTSALGATIESMSREIRVGQEFTDSGSGISFESFYTHDEDPEDVSFALSGSVLTRNGIQISPTDVVIESGKFILSQKDSCSPWKITIVLRAHPKNFTGSEETVNVQTSVSSRILPIDVKGDPHQCKTM